MDRDKVIDAHCHLFNAQYAVMELVAATWNMLWGNYPHRGAGKTKRAVRGFTGAAEGVADFAAWIARLVQAGLAGCEKSYGIELDNFAESRLAGRGALTVTPLMMDIYFALDDNRGEEVKAEGRRKALAEPVEFEVAPDREEEFNAHFDSIAALVRGERQKVRRGEPSVGADPLDAMFEEARSELLARPAKARRGGEYDGIELSPGYKKHMRDLEALKDKYENVVFPFLAIDPRRIGIMKLIDLKIAKGQGPFKGVKLYPPLGYLPTHPNLQEVYEYCTRWDIPVTVHCSDGGVQNFKKENYVVDTAGPSHLEDFASTKGNKSLYYTAPEKWRPVMERWPGLRINFAHFGGGDNFVSDDTQWKERILAILEQYPNAHTDMSYFTNEGLAEAVQHAVERHGILARRLMFGTDYVMIMLDRNLGGLRNYFDRFAGLDQALLAHNAQAFLKI